MANHEEEFIKKVSKFEMNWDVYLAFITPIISRMSVVKFQLDYFKGDKTLLKLEYTVLEGQEKYVEEAFQMRNKKKDDFWKGV